MSNLCIPTNTSKAPKKVKSISNLKKVDKGDANSKVQHSFGNTDSISDLFIQANFYQKEYNRISKVNDFLDKTLIQFSKFLSTKNPNDLKDIALPPINFEGNEKLKKEIAWINYLLKYLQKKAERKNKSINQLSQEESTF